MDRRKICRQGLRPCGNVACAEAYDDVARTRDIVDNRREMPGRHKCRHRGMAVVMQAVDQSIAVDAFNGRFACRVHVGNDDVVGIVEALAEIFKTESEGG